MKNQIYELWHEDEVWPVAIKNKNDSFVNVKDILLSVCILHLSLSSKTFQ